MLTNTRGKKTGYRNEKGQILLIVVFIMTIALSAGIVMSNRFISNLKNRTDSDDSSKALAIAEALVEKILLLPTETLRTYALNNSCGTDCHLEVTDTNGQLIFADAALSLDGQSTTEAYPVSLNLSQSVEISLAGYTSDQNVYVCWNTDASVEVLYYYSKSGEIKAVPYAYNPVSIPHPENNFSTAVSLFGYNSCATVDAIEIPQAIRIKPYYDDTDVYILPAAGYALPVQGIMIKSTGHTGTARRSVTVVKTNPYTPTMFDYVLYQKSETDPLSN